MAAQPKIFAGFSDITTLNLALNRRGLPTLHAPMALTLHYPRPNWVLQNFKEALKGNLSHHPEAPRAETLIKGKAEGITTGGCLCLLCDSIATPDALDATGKILFIEDVDELPHRIDAMLTHLRNAGIIQKAAGIVIGEMTRSDEQPDDGTPKRPWREIVQDRLKDLNIPTIVNFPFGHVKEMLTVGLGLRVRLDADAGRIEYLEPFCA
jgi:muramoyltetrapeptide carboxypeptidase